MTRCGINDIICRPLLCSKSHDSSTTRPKDWSSLTRILKDPNTVEESVILVPALIESNCLESAQTRLNVATDVDAATRAELQNKITTRNLMR